LCFKLWIFVFFDFQQIGVHSIYSFFFFFFFFFLYFFFFFFFFFCPLFDFYIIIHYPFGSKLASKYAILFNLSLASSIKLFMLIHNNVFIFVYHGIFSIFSIFFIKKNWFIISSNDICSCRSSFFSRNFSFNYNSFILFLFLLLFIIFFCAAETLILLDKSNY